MAVLLNVRVPVLLCERELGSNSWREMLDRLGPLENAPVMVVAPGNRTRTCGLKL